MFSTSIQKPQCLFQLASKHRCNSNYYNLLLFTLKDSDLQKVFSKNNKYIFPGNSTAEVTF